jgi:hypothetical protein
MVDGVLSTTKAEVVDKLLQKKLSLADTRSIDLIISSQHSGPTDVEVQITEVRLQEAKRRKAVKESLNEYGEEAPKDGQAKDSLQDSRYRKQYMTEERRAQETAEFARKRKLREDKIERERRRKQKETEMPHKTKLVFNDNEGMKCLRAEE